MHFLTYRPRPPLNAFVERFWLCLDGQSPRRERILPSGTLELVVNLHDDAVRIYESAESPRVETHAGVVVSGTYARAFVIDAMQHAAMFGVHFSPGGAFAVLGVPANGLANAHVDVAALWGDREARELRERLCAAATPRARFLLMEAALLGRMRMSIDRPDRARMLSRHPAIPFALHAFGDDGAGASVREVARAVGLSQRRLIEIFTREVGLTPKLFCRVLRFRHVHALAERTCAAAAAAASQTGRVDWADLALACGYFDQSHLSNEFRELSGLTPTAYLRQAQQRTNLLHGHVAIA
jgi:AraC-like DNA-binding protein